jgi:hypothetical protein
VILGRMRIASISLAGLMVLTATSAMASEGDAQQRSVALFKEGVALGKAGDYARAEVAFRTSYVLVPSPSTLRNWALTEMKLGKLVSALGHLKLAIQSPGLTTEQQAIVHQNLADAYAATGHIAIKTTDGASVAVDGVLVDGTAPFTASVDVEAGSRQVEARLGSQSAHAEVDAKAGRVVEVNVPVLLSGPVASSQVATSSPAQASELQRIPAGAVGDQAREQTRTWWTTPHAVGVGLAAAAAVGLGLGIYFDAAANQAASDANSLRAGLMGQCSGPAAPVECVSLRDKIDTIHQDETLQWTSIGVGTAAGLGAVALLVLVRPGGAVRTGSMRWTPIVGPQSGGIAGSF